MSFPWVMEDTFEGGSTNFDAETDTQSILDFPHYVTLCDTPPHQPPFRGAYCARINLATQSGETEASLQHNALDMSADTARCFRWYMYVHNLVTAASDRIQIFSIRATDTEHVIVEVFNNAGTYVLRSGQSSAGTLRSVELVQDKWLCMELVLAYDGSANGGGTIAFFVDNVQIGATLTGLTQAASTRFNLGTFIGGNTVAASNVNTGVTSGVLLFDQFLIDDTRIGPLARFPQTILLTESGHAALGPGQVEEYYLLDGGSSDTVIELYDTDEAVTTQAPFVPRLEDTASNRIGDNWLSMGQFNKGCYVSLSGTDPQAWVTFRDAVVTEEGVRQAAKRRLR
jgi:hypothetical protein